VLALLFFRAVFAAETAELELHDTKRKRDIPLKVYYPKGKTSLPLVIFSHGLGGSCESYSYLGEYWAEHGYVVILPTHAGSDSAIFQKGHPFRNL
jgi:predicted dienelactone hydrolase